MQFPIVLQSAAGAPGIAWSPDGNTLATTSEGTNILLWDAAGNRLRALIAPTEPLAGLAFSLDGTKLATALDNGRICLWDTGTGDSLPIVCDPVFDTPVLAWSHDGAMLVSASGTTVKLWDSYSGQPKRILQSPHEAYCAAWSPDSRFIAVAGDSSHVGVWNVTGSMRKRFASHAQQVFALAWSPDGKYLATGGDNAYIHIWDVTKSDAAGLLDGDGESIVALAFSHDGKYVAAKSTDGKLQIWNRERNSEPIMVIHEGAARNDRFCTLAFHPSAYIVAGAESPGGRVRLRLAVQETTLFDTAVAPKTADPVGVAQEVAVVDAKPIQVFVSYSHAERKYLDMLRPYLEKLQQDGAIEAWTDRSILPGTLWEQEIDKRLNTAQVVLLVMTQEFLVSRYCQAIEVDRALQMQKDGKVVVIPILMEECDWKNTRTINQFQFLPEDGTPVLSSTDQKKALLNVSDGIRKVVNQLRVTKEL
jgi:hypothetical protein